MFTKSDLIISRSGALVLSEMALMGKAMVLVPYPHSASNHQIKNAEAFADAGAAILIEQSNLDKGVLEDTVFELFKNKDEIKYMENNSRKLATPNATSEIINTIINVIKN